MNADGSERRPLAEGVRVAHALGSPNVVWSPDGTRVGYATESDAYDRLRIWAAALDGSDRVLVVDEAAAAAAFGRDNGTGGGPVWSPDGTGLAFQYGNTWLIANADGTGDVRKIDELQYRSWRGGWYFCECYG